VTMEKEKLNRAVHKRSTRWSEKKKLTGRCKFQRRRRESQREGDRYTVVKKAIVDLQEEAPTLI